MEVKPEDLTPLARLALQTSASGDAAAALRLLRDAVDESPKSAICQFMLGAHLAQDGDVSAAESAMAAAVQLEPTFHIARFQLGLLQFTSNRIAEGLLTWKPLAALGDNEPLAHFAKAFAEAAAERFESARASFERGIALNTANESLNQNMQIVLQRIESLTKEERGGSSGPGAGNSGASR